MLWPPLARVSCRALPAHDAFAAQFQNFLDYAVPVIQGSGHDDFRRKRALVALDAQPGHALLCRDAYRAGYLLRRAGEDIGAGVDLGVDGFSGQCGVTEVAREGHVNLGVRIGGLDAGQEAVDMQLGIAGINRADQADNVGLGQRGGDDAQHVAAFVGAGGS